MPVNRDRRVEATRSTIKKKNLTARQDVRMTEDMKDTLGKLAEERGPDVDVSDIVREMIEFSIEGREPAPLPVPTVSEMLSEAMQSGELQQALVNGGLRMPVLGSAPCGPFREVVAETNIHHFLSPATVEWLDAGGRDVFIICNGQSMEGAGIPNGALLMMRPLPQGGFPQEGDVALVQIVDDNGNYTSTVKRWVRSQPLELHDGDDNPVELPTNYKEVIPVAVARGIVSRYK